MKQFSLQLERIMLKPFRTASIDFEFLKEIGHNGKNSNTFVARDPQMNSEMVVKTIRKTSFLSVDAYFTEAQALHASSHPHVAKIQYACYDNDNVYIAMPYYKNGSIKELITGKLITVRECITLSTQILSALQNIHSKQLIHFDIKPDNILLSSRNEALVSDFGLTKHTNNFQSATPDKIYGRMYPPEVFSQNSFDKKFDIYQFGLTLYRMCNGNDNFYTQFNKYLVNGLFDRKSYQEDVIGGKFPDRKNYHPHIPTTLRNVINKCLKVNPAERYNSAIDVINALSNIDGPQLDWQPQFTAIDRTWIKHDGESIYKISIDSQNNTTGTKTSSAGSTRKRSEWCKVGATEKDLYAMLAS